MGTSKEHARLGTVLKDKYRLDAVLGVGGMGAVYRATHTQIGRTVAIKLLLDEHSDNEDLAARFFREARVATLVRHPHVVEVLDVDRDERGQPYIVQELLEGEDLSAHIREHPEGLPIDVVLGLLTPVAEAVGVAHDHGVVHRDLKPENIFLSREGGVVVPKVLDFGISKVPVEVGQDRRTATNIIMGSPTYMSPEQIQRPKTVDVRADVWALGVVLYEALTGRLPFEGESLGLLFVRICTEDVTPISSALPSIPPALADVMSGCLARDRELRIPNGRVLAARLTQVANGRPVRAVAPTAQGSAKTEMRRPGITASSLERPKNPAPQHMVATGATTMAATGDGDRPPTDFGAWTVPEDLVLNLEGPVEAAPSPRPPPEVAPAEPRVNAPRAVAPPNRGEAGANLELEVGPELELELEHVAPQSRRWGRGRRPARVASSSMGVTNLVTSAALVVFCAWLTPNLMASRPAVTEGLGDFAPLLYLALGLVMFATGAGVAGKGLKLHSYSIGLAGAGILGVAAASVVAALSVFAPGVASVERLARYSTTIALGGGASTALGFGTYALANAKERWIAGGRSWAIWMVLLALGGLAVGTDLVIRATVLMEARLDLVGNPALVD